MGGTASTRSYIVLCQKGYYCTGKTTGTFKRRAPCPAGSYGKSTGMSTSTCSGTCSSGFYCLSGSIDSAGRPHCLPGSGGGYCECGRNTDGTNIANPENYFCPSGSSGRQTVSTSGTGYYSAPTHNLVTGAVWNPRRRYEQKSCGTGYACENGIRYPKIEWKSGCVYDEPDTYTNARANIVVDEIPSQSAWMNVLTPERLFVAYRYE